MTRRLSTRITTRALVGALACVACRPAPVEAPVEVEVSPAPTLFVEREQAEATPPVVAREGQVFVPVGATVIGTDPAEVDELLALCERMAPGQCQREWFDTEQPRRNLVVGGFWIDRLEVSNAAYETCVAAGDCPVRQLAACQRYDGDGGGWSEVDPDRLARFLEPQQPAVCVSIDEAENYCRARGGRLPSSSEWEKAARGPDGRRWPWGDALPDCTRAQFHDPERGLGCGRGTSSEVGTHPDNVSVYGALDMAGNVSEWVRPDVGADGMYVETPGFEAEHEIRGGHWGTEAVYLRGAERGFFSTQQQTIYVGFRCVGG